MTRTVAFTDLANYTAAVSRSDREGLRRMLKEHEELVQPIVRRNGGRVVKNLGDSFMCLFHAATDGLRAALEIQTVVQDSDRISIRLAMTTGDVEEIEGDAFGESVNLAARILSATPAGEVWFGPGTRVCMNAAEIPWESVGRLGFKGIPGKKEVFRAVPRHRCYLPAPVLEAAKQGTLVRVRRGAPPPRIRGERVLLLEGFAPGSASLSEAVDRLPVVNPGNLWLSTYNVASADRNGWVDVGRGLVIGTPEAVSHSLEEALRTVNRTTGSDTIVLDARASADLELELCGLALPAVPIKEVVASYFYDLLPNGRWVNRSDRALLRVEVLPKGVFLQGLSPGIIVAGKPVVSGQTVKLEHGDEIRSSAGTVHFQPSNAYAAAQRYAGLLIAPSEMRLGVMSGQVTQIGRDPEPPGLPFQDRRGQDNIRWCSGQQAAKARARGFTLDRALAGRRQASVQIDGGRITLVPLHNFCPTFVQRENEGTMQQATTALPLSIGDRIIAGTSVVQVMEPEE